MTLQRERFTSMMSYGHIRKGIPETSAYLMEHLREGSYKWYTNVKAGKPCRNLHEANTGQRGA